MDERPESETVAEFCRRHRLIRLAVFGSEARGEADANSDVDLLYEFEPGHVPGWEFVRIREEASRLFGGRVVDMVSFKYVNRHIRERVLAEAKLLYEAA